MGTWENVCVLATVEMTHHYFEKPGDEPRMSPDVVIGA